jgi:uncharacterized protein YcnI
MVSAACCLPTSNSAFAHVVITSPSAKAGGYAKLTIGIGHGCDGSPTKAITVTIPIEIIAAKPQIHWNWSSTTKLEKLERPYTSHGTTISERVAVVTFVAKEPVADDRYDELGLSVRVAQDAKGDLVLPVKQECEKGTIEWKDGKEAKSEYPAPKLRVQRNRTEQGNAHSH